MMIQAVFLDRDGVINEDIPFISHPSQLKLVEGAAEAIRRLNDAGILVIVVTNQPVVARNLCTEKELNIIHEHLREMLKERCDAVLDAIYYCPHHPEKHHPDGNPAYRMNCECRKPKTGMIDKAVKEFGLDRSLCVLIGDSSRDIIAGQRAGLKTILIDTGSENVKAALALNPDRVVSSLKEAVSRLLSSE